MGRTMSTSRDVLDRLEFEWRDYRRALTREEQDLFDALWQKARRHASAMSNQTPLDPMQAVFLSVLIEQAREIAALHRRNDADDGNTNVTNDHQRHIPGDVRGG